MKNLNRTITLQRLGRDLGGFGIELKDKPSLGKEDDQEREVGFGEGHENEPLKCREGDGCADTDSSNAMVSS